MLAYALFLAFPECAIWQVAPLQRALRQHGWTMRTVTVDQPTVSTDGGLVLTAQATVHTLYPRDARLLLMAGGDISGTLADDPSLHRFLRQYDLGRGWIAAIGNAWRPLAAAGLAGGRRLAVDGPLPERADVEGLHRAVFDSGPTAVDGNLITARSSAVAAFTAQVLTCLRLSAPADGPRDRFDGGRPSTHR